MYAWLVWGKVYLILINFHDCGTNHIILTRLRPWGSVVLRPSLGCLTPRVSPAEGYVPRGYVTFREDSGGGAREGGDALRFRDVTAPITSDDDFAPDSPERGESRGWGCPSPSSPSIDDNATTRSVWTPTCNPLGCTFILFFILLKIFKVHDQSVKDCFRVHCFDKTATKLQWNKPYVKTPINHTVAQTTLL